MIRYATYLVLGTLAGPLAAQTPAAPRTLAQALVDRMVRANPDLVAAEIALRTAAKCTTVAATDPQDIGEDCDDDELGPIRTGAPTVEAPTADDRVYDITQALHDAMGKLIGAVGMDLAPQGRDRTAMVARARALLAELEAAIPSAAALTRPAPGS